MNNISRSLLLSFLLFGCGKAFQVRHHQEETHSLPPTPFVGSISATQAVADGVDQSVVTIKMIDSSAAPIAGVTPQLFFDGTFNIVSPCTASNALGESVCRLTSTRAGARPLNVLTPTEFSGSIVFIAGPPATIEVTMGNNQSGEVGSNLLINPVIRIADQFDNPIQNLPVTFTPSGNGTVGSSPVNTSPAGEASPGTWRLSTTAGPNTLTATAGSLSVVINATGIPVDPLRLVYFPAGSCSTGELEVYVNGAPHPRFQFIATNDCLELIDSASRGTLQVRCVDRSGAALPSDFVGPATETLSRTHSVCRTIHRAS
ncbi:MAG: Ig-like domain-containing protein [Bdellovibrionales bacterium]|nr:Ig-like domain-containing protein [Bdellovibrionales bacterium]